MVNTGQINKDIHPTTPTDLAQPRRVHLDLKGAAVVVQQQEVGGGDPGGGAPGFLGGVWGLGGCQRQV
jgi:hypothetical protein